MTADQVRTASMVLMGAYAVHSLGRYAMGGFKKLGKALQHKRKGTSSAVRGIDGPMCFVAGTLISMADGSFKPIEQIKKGDKVLSRDEKTGKTAAKTIEATTKKQAAATLVLTFLIFP